MGRSLKKGFTIVEVVIMTSLVMTTVGFSLFGLSSVTKSQNSYQMHYLLSLNEYNIIQIIKNDHAFYAHPEDYFGDVSLIEKTSTGTQQHITLYFDKNNNLCDSGVYEGYIKIICTPTTSTSNTRYYYTLQKYMKNNNHLDVRQGGIVNFTVYDA